MIVLALKIAVVLAAWIAAGLGLILGPMLRERSSAYPALDGDV